MSLVDTFLYVEVYADRTGQSSAPLAEFLEGKILLSGRKLHWLLNKNCELICFSIDFLQVFLRKILIKAGIVTVRVLNCEKFKYTDDGNLLITDEKYKLTLKCQAAQVRIYQLQVPILFDEFK